MKKMDNWQMWLVVDLETGAQDGFYRYRADAEGARGRLAEKFPGQWMVVSADTRRNPRGHIPEHMFWTERMGFQ